MKVKIKVPRIVDVTHVKIVIPLKHIDENPDAYPIPMQHNEQWIAFVNIDTGIINAWPKGTSCHIHEKVCDSGVYELYDVDSNFIIRRCDYVPHGLIPGKWGDYIELNIDENGKILNWPNNPNLHDFFGDDENQ